MIMNETLKYILTRRSVRAYKPDAIPYDMLEVILKAGQAAPYVNVHCRHFSVIRDREMIGRLNEAAKEEGMKMGEFQQKMFSAPGFDGTYGAPVVIVLSGNESTLQYEGVCAASIQNMLVAAKSLGIGSCWAYYPIFAFHGDEAGAWREELRIPEGYKPCAAVLLGYGLEEEAAEEMVDMTDTAKMTDLANLIEEMDVRYKNAIEYV